MTCIGSEGYTFRPATGDYLHCHTGTLALRVHVVRLGRDRCPGVPTPDLYLLCVSV